MSKRPLPTALKVLQGTARPGRTNKNEPKPPVESPSCPPHLSKAAKTEWRRMAPLLESQGLLSKIDRAALAAYCELWARWIKAETEIQANGEVVTTPNGSIQVSPWLSIAHRSMAELRKFAIEFGLSPASRSKVTATPVSKGRNPFDELDNPKSRFFK